jgi:glycosyltransferase involved in cell wall biosynthesis
MKLGFIASRFVPGVADDDGFLHRLVIDLQKRGHQVAVVAPWRPSETDTELPYPLIQAPRPWSRRFFVGNGAPSLLYAQLRHRLELIHCHGEYRSACAAHTVNMLTGVPFICRVLGSGFAAADADPKVRDKLLHVLSASSKLVAPGNFLRNRALEYDLPEDRVSVINNGVRTLEVRRGFDEDSPIAAPYVLYGGGLQRPAGADIMLKGFAHVAERFPEIKLAMVGKGGELTAFNQEVAEYGLADRVLYLGECDRRTMLALYCNCLLYAAPARRAPFSNANLEAMAAGRPLVVSAVDGNMEQIRNGEEGYLVPVGDDVALADALANLLADPDLRESMGKASAERGHYYSWANMVDRFEDCYRDVIDSRSAT